MFFLGSISRLTITLLRLGFGPKKLQETRDYNCVQVLIFNKSSQDSMEGKNKQGGEGRKQAGPSLKQKRNTKGRGEKKGKTEATKTETITVPQWTPPGGLPGLSGNSR